MTTSRRDARTGARWTPTQRLKNDAIYWGARATLQLADRLPAAGLLAVGRASGSVACSLLSGPRKVALANVRLALPEEDAPAVTRRCFRHAGENLAVSLLLRRPEVRALDLVHVSSAARSLLRDTLAEGRGAVFVSAHLGPFELVAAVVAELGLRPAVVVRESYDRRLDAVVDQHRTERGVQIIHRGRAGASSRIVRALRDGRPVGMLPDLGGRIPSAPGRLLGQDVGIPVGPQRIAIRAGCPVLVGTLAPMPSQQAHLGRQPKSSTPRFELRLSLLEDHDEGALGQQIAETLTDRIRASADHWLWMAPRFHRSS